MFLVWASANVLLFNLLFSLMPSLLYHTAFATEPFAFTVDNLLLVFNSILQAQMCLRCRGILDEARNKADWPLELFPPAFGP